MRSIFMLITIVAGLIFSSCEKEESIALQKVTDVDGNDYKTVTIGTQVWIAENLKVTRSSDGNALDNSIPSNDIHYINTYGRLYDWKSALKACPEGWRLPSSTEWFILLSHLDKSITNPDSTGFLGEQTGEVLKSNRLWPHPNSGATNSTGFSALPTGYFARGNMEGEGITTNFWSSTDGNDGQAFGGINISYNSFSVFRGYSNKDAGHCVRCLKDQ